MKLYWGETELSEHWSLTSAEHDMVAAYSGKNRLGIATQLKYLQIEGCFPRRLTNIPPLATEYLAQQLNISPTN